MAVTSFQTSLAGLTPSVATQNVVTLGGILSLSSGGTGATNQPAAANAVLPIQAGMVGKVLTTNGSNTYWAAASSATGSGTVTSITGSGGSTGLTLGGGPITTSGTLTLGGTLAITNGGTGGNSRITGLNNLLPTQGGFAGQVLTTDGTNAIWLPVLAAGTVKSVNVNGGTTGLSFFGGPVVNSGVITMTGTLSVANGGTGQSTPNQALNALLPIQTAGTAGLFLMSTGVDATWVAAGGGGGVGTGTVTSVNVSGGTTGLSFTGGPVTTAGTIIASGVLAAANGGTGVDTSAAPLGSLLIGNGAGMSLNAMTSDAYLNIDTTVAGNIDLSIVNPYVTLGSTVAYLGDTELVLAGLTSVTVTQPPVNANDLATKAYVDSVASSLSVKAPANCATTANLVALSGLLTIDGYTVVAGNRVLVKNQSTSTQDGVYVAAAGPWTRAVDMDTNPELVSASVFVIAGGQASTTWVQTDPTPGTNQTWVQFAGAGTYTAGTGLNLTGNQFKIADTTVVTGLYGNATNSAQIQINQQGQITSAVNVPISAVTTINGGLTGLTPLTATGGNVTLGGIINPLSGGTGIDSSNASDGQIWIADGASAPGAGDAAFSLATITAGANITITNGPGTITIAGAAAGVTSFSGGTTGLLPNTPTTGVVTLTGTLAIANGGTGQVTANDAFNALAPGQTLNTGKYLSTDGFNTSWVNLPTGARSNYAFTITTGGTLASKLTAAAITDAAGNIYEIFNSTAGALTLTGTTITNTVAFSSVSTASTIIVPASGSVTITTTTAGTTYSVIASNLGTGAVSPATLGDIPTLLADGSLVDSGKYFDDTTTTNSNYWSANQTSAYVTNQLLNVPSLPQVNVASTANLGLTGLAAIDGYTPIAGDFVLVKNQTTSGQNGIYKAAAGAWTRQVYNTTTKVYDNIGAQTLYSELNINGGVTNVVSGTVNKNLQFQFYIPIPTATIATNGSSVFVTAVTKLPQASIFNRWVDNTIGNDTLNNGSSSFPYATMTKALVGLSFPSTITIPSGGIDASAITWVAGQQNCVIQGFDLAHDGGQTVLSGAVTFATGSTRNDYVNTTHSNVAPFTFQSGALYRNYFQGITISATAGADWLGLHSTATNWITLDNVDFANSLATAVNLPAFSNAFTINVFNQARSLLRFTGVGAANTTIVVNNCVDGYVQIPSTYLGQIAWQGAGFSGALGSAAVPTGILSNQTAMDTVTGWVSDSTYDGWYAIDNFAPTTFAQGGIFGKFTIGGTTFLYWGRTQAQAPATISTTTQATYQKTGTGWSLIGGTSALAQDLSGGAAGQVVWQQGVDNSAFTAVGTAGQQLLSAGTSSPIWATVPKSNVFAISTSGTMASYITFFSKTDVVGASYVLTNTSGSAITVSATAFTNYAGFSEASATATSFILTPNQTAVLTTTVINSTYAIDSISGLGGGSAVYNLTSATSALLSALLTTASLTDKAGAVYSINNSSAGSITITTASILNQGAFPGYTNATTLAIPANGTALITTASPNASYYVLNISNSVASNLSSGTAMEMPYQTAANTTAFIPNAAGDSGKVLTSKGNAVAPAWVNAPGTHYLAVAANSTVAALITAASITDVATASYAITNTAVASVNVTATNFVNSASFSTVATATQITLKPNQTVVISTRTAGTNYVIDSVSGLGGGGTTALTIATGGTLASLLTTASVSDQVGNTYVVTNTAATTTPLTLGTTINNVSSFPRNIAAAVVTLLPYQVVTLTTTTVDTAYTVENISDVQSVYSLTTAVDATFASLLVAPIFDVVGNVYTINNTDTAAHTITFAALTGYTAFAGQTTNTTIIIPAGGSATVSTKTVNADYQVITIANKLLKTYYVAYSAVGATKTVTSLLTDASITDAVGNNYVIYGTVAGGFKLTTTKFLNWESYPRIGTSLTEIAFPQTYTVELTTSVVGSEYAITAASQTLPVASVDFAANKLVTDLPATGKTDIIGQIYSVYNSGGSSLTLTTTGAFSNISSYPNNGSGLVLTIQAKQTVTLVTESVGLNYRILSVSDATGVYSISTAVSGTIPALLSFVNVNDVKNNIYTIMNSGATTISLSATGYIGYQAYANQATATTLALLPGGSAVLSVNTAGTSYQIMNVSATGSASTNCFSVGATNAITIPGVTGVIGFNTVNFDPMSWWNAAQSRWIPKVAGYYQVNLNVGVAVGSVDVVAAISKNGIEQATDNCGLRGGYSSIAVSTVVYMNGTTDYLQGGGRAGAASAGINWTSLSASLQTAQPAVAASNSLARATVAVAQAVINNANTKMVFGTAVYNPRGWFDSINNYRFQPNVAGYYQVTGSVAYTNAWSSGVSQLAIYKNGSSAAYNQTGPTNQGNMFCEVNDLIYMDGGADYLELYVFQNSGSTQTITFNTQTCYFDATLVGGLAVATGAVTAPTDNVFKAIATNGGTGPAIGTSATKVSLTNEQYDPLGAYDVATGKFIPKTAGYYRIIGRLAPAIAGTSVTAYIYVNGVAAAINQTSSGTFAAVSEVSTNVYLNGTTDYVELYGDASAATTARTTTGGVYCEFSGELVGGVSVNPITTGPQLFKTFYGLPLNTFVGLPGDPIQIAWGSNGSNWNIYMKTTSGTITPVGWVYYTRGPGGGGAAEGNYFGSGYSSQITSITTTSQRVNGWGFNAIGDSLTFDFIDPATGYTYQIKTMLGPSGANCVYTIQRNSNNA